MAKRRLQPRKLLVASSGVATISYLMSGCDAPRYSSVANLMAPVSSTQQEAGVGNPPDAGGPPHPTGVIANLPAPPAMPVPSPVIANLPAPPSPMPSPVIANLPAPPVMPAPFPSPVIANLPAPPVMPAPFPSPVIANLPAPPVMETGGTGGMGGGTGMPASDAGLGGKASLDASVDAPDAQAPDASTDASTP
ncbi:MAG TPA: hypothetical protein VHM70_00880 [Polyangiaceae bacterium]|nr:hypothetical protein [Polyangiaceae bacterium]